MPPRPTLVLPAQIKCKLVADLDLLRLSVSVSTTDGVIHPYPGRFRRHDDVKKAIDLALATDGCRDKVLSRLAGKALKSSVLPRYRLRWLGSRISRVRNVSPGIRNHELVFLACEIHYGPVNLCQCNNLKLQSPSFAPALLWLDGFGDPVERKPEA